jgi:hypothetical protein
VFLEADVDVDPVDPQVDVVHIGEVPGGEGALLSPPGLGQLGDHRGGQPRRRAQELAQRRPEVAGGQAVQVQQRQYLGDLRGLAAPWRQDRRGEPRSLAGVGIDSAVVDPRRVDRHGAGTGEHLAGLVVAIAHHQSVAALVALVGEPSDALLDLGLQRLGQHPPGTLTDNLIDQRRRLAQLDAPDAGVVSYGLGGYGEHGSYLPDQHCCAGLLENLHSITGKVRPSRSSTDIRSS